MADAPEIDGAFMWPAARPRAVGEIATVKIERADEYDLHAPRSASSRSAVKLHRICRAAPCRARPRVFRQRLAVAEKKSA